MFRTHLNVLIHYSFSTLLVTFTITCRYARVMVFMPNLVQVCGWNKRETVGAVFLRLVKDS